MPKTHNRIMLSPYEHALASQMARPPYQRTWHSAVAVFKRSLPRSEHDRERSSNPWHGL